MRDIAPIFITLFDMRVLGHLYSDCRREVLRRRFVSRKSIVLYCMVYITYGKLLHLVSRDIVCTFIRLIIFSLSFVSDNILFIY